MRSSRAAIFATWASSAVGSMLVFRACPVIELPGYSRPLISVSDYLELVESSTYRGDRVRAA
jgi:hypothetical protein